MFGIFSRKQQPAAKVPNDVQSDAMAVDPEPKQLRTPSPSEAAFNGLGLPANITLTSAGSSNQSPDSSKPALPPTPEALHSLVATIPAKTLHAYVLAQIPECPPDILAALASFFATLKPPPLIHCARCHADYTQVENGDRSCRVPHDDESAEVEWVGRSGRYNSEYETYWGCCGKTVEGEGDLGPPDGWCYEGMHTPDTKRARFRADSTNAEDKLVSCLELNCHNTHPTLPSKSANSRRRVKRARPTAAEEDDDVGHDYDDCGSVGTEDAGMAEIAHGVGELGQKRKGKAKDNGSSNSKGKARAKPKSAADATAASATSTPAQARTRVRMQVPAEPDTDGGSNKDAGSAGAPAARARTSRRRRRSDAKPRSAASSGSKATSPPASPVTRGRKPPSKMDSVEIVLRSRSSTRSRVRGGGADTGDEKTMTDTEGKVRKRRKVAAPAAAA